MSRLTHLTQDQVLILSEQLLNSVIPSKMPTGEEVKERKLEHWYTLIRSLDLVKALVCNHNYKEQKERDMIRSMSHVLYLLYAYIYIFTLCILNTVMHIYNDLMSHSVSTCSIFVMLCIKHRER